jgi:hypothetical protein
MLLGAFRACRPGQQGPRSAKTLPPSPWRISAVAGLAACDGRRCHLAPACRVVGGRTGSRVPWLCGRSPASPLLRTPPPPSRLQPTSRCCRLYGRPCSADFATGRGGLRQWRDASLSPCCHFHPAGVTERLSQSTIRPAAFAPSVAGSASGDAHFRGHSCVRLRYGPVTRRHPKEDAVDGLQKCSFPPPCHPSDKASGFSLGSG